MTNAMRLVLLDGDLPGVELSRRATERLAAIRGEFSPAVDSEALVVAPWDAGQVRWWTWAGARANGVVAAALASVRPGLVDELDRCDNRYVKLRGDATMGEVGEALRAARDAHGGGSRASRGACQRRCVEAAEVLRAAAPRVGRGDPVVACRRSRRLPRNRWRVARRRCAPAGLTPPFLQRADDTCRQRIPCR